MIPPRIRRRITWAALIVCCGCLVAAVTVPAIRRHNTAAGLICVTALVGITAAVASLRASRSQP